MSPSNAARRLPDRGRMLVLLLAICIAAPLLLDRRTFTWMPQWLGGAVSLAALLAALSVYRRSGALRGRFLALFVAAIVLAALAGQLSTWQA